MNTPVIKHLRRKLMDNKILNRVAAPGENWEQVLDRVADAVAANPVEEKDFRDMLNYALPNSPALRNLGINNGSASACFVLPIEDSRASIFKTLAQAVEVQAFGGGTGFSFSKLRPKGSIIKSTGGKSSGPISFIEIFDKALGDIIRQGGVRAGANMGVLRVDHPDILEFINAKREEGKLSNFNLSVGITDAFIEAVKQNKNIQLEWRDEEKTLRASKTVKARDIMEQIAKNAYETGEPGVLFLDRINQKHPFPWEGPIEASNPCGEQPLIPYGSCTLASINVSKCVINPWTDKADVNWGQLAHITKTLVRFLDNIIDMNHYPLSEIKETALRTRQIGIGIMGFADLLLKLGLRYGSPESATMASHVMTYIYDDANQASIELGRQKGFAPTYEAAPEDIQKRRNGALVTCAPTGTLSLLAGCSSGIEPHFAFEYSKRLMDGEITVKAPIVEEYLAVSGNTKLPDYFVTAHEVRPDEHLAVQAAFQQYVDAAVSKTINLPNNATREQIYNLILKAHEFGLKGLTVYRDGSRKFQALSKKSKKSKQENEIASESKQENGLARGSIKSRPRITQAGVIRQQTACGKLYCEVAFDKEGPLEVFLRTVGGGCEANAQAVGVLTSLCLRAGVKAEEVARRLQQIDCRACTRAIAKGNGVEVRSCAAGVGKSISVLLGQRKVYQAMAASVSNLDEEFPNPNKTGNTLPKSAGISCPDCGAQMYAAEGCVTCPNCGWTKC